MHADSILGAADKVLDKIQNLFVKDGISGHSSRHPRWYKMEYLGRIGAYPWGIVQEMLHLTDMNHPDVGVELWKVRREERRPWMSLFSVSSKSNSKYSIWWADSLFEVFNDHQAYQWRLSFWNWLRWETREINISESVDGFEKLYTIQCWVNVQRVVMHHFWSLSHFHQYCPWPPSSLPPISLPAWAYPIFLACSRCLFFPSASSDTCLPQWSRNHKFDCTKLSLLYLFPKEIKQRQFVTRPKMVSPSPMVLPKTSIIAGQQIHRESL